MKEANPSNKKCEEIMNVSADKNWSPKKKDIVVFKSPTTLRAPNYNWSKNAPVASTYECETSIATKNRNFRRHFSFLAALNP